MKVQRMTVCKVLVALVAGIGLAAVAAPGFAQSTPGNPEMMEGYGPGYGMGPGMMGGYGPGYYGRGYYGRGYGPGYGMGPGMMRGYGPGYGMGPGMMRGYGGMGYGMGPGMMMGGCGGYGYGYNALDLTDAQREKIRKIEEDTARAQWEIMSKMHEAMAQGWQEAHKKIDAVLTKEQREQLKRGWRGR